jgi:hypothetical protein
MSVLGVGAGLKEFQKLFEPRVTELARDFIAPLDELSNAVGRAEQELKALQSRQLGETAQIWSRYKPEYERYLRPQPLTDEEEEQDKLAVRETSAQAEQRSAGDDQTGPVAEASEPASDQRPTDADEATVPEGSEAIGESDLQPSEEISS